MKSQSADDFANFFEIQQYRKRLSWLFFGLFAGVVGLHVLLLLIVFVIIIGNLTSVNGFSWWLISLLVFFGILVIGASLRAQRIHNDGSQFAKNMGAVRLFVGQFTNEDVASEDKVQYFSTFIRANCARDLPSAYARLYEFCEQMSIASGIALPMIYVLPHEKGVNACVAGDRNHTALIVTQGAVEQLCNEQLYALIAHEYGHILHGDAKFNLRLSVMMAGLSLLYESAEWLEQVMFGHFDANYHARYEYHHVQFGKSPSVISFQNAKQWALHYTKRQAKIQKTDQWHQSDQDGPVVSILILMAVLVIYRMIGVFGMASHEWLCQKFNRQREFLADATAVQLTRSFAIADLLKDMTHKFDTKLYSTQVSAFSYFFLADPRAEDERFFSSHPDLIERIKAIDQHTFFDFSQKIIVHFDEILLQKVADDVGEHKPIHTLEEEMQAKASDLTPYFEHDFEEGFEQVIDGRLVIDQAWRAGFLKPAPTYLDDIICCNLSNSDVVFDHEQLAWEISKYLRKPIGALAVLQGVLLSRHNVIAIKPDAVFSQYHLGEVFIAHCFDQHFNQGFNQSGNERQRTYLHNYKISNDLLLNIAQLPNNHRYKLLIYTLKVLQFRLKNPIVQDDGLDKILDNYYHDLWQLLSFGLPKQTDVFTKSAFDGQLDKLISALTMVFMLDLLASLKHNQKQQNWSNHFNHAFLNDFIGHYDIKMGDLNQIKQYLAQMTLFLCSLQNNHFLLKQMDDIMTYANRAWRLMAFSSDMLSDILKPDDIIAYHKMGVDDWVKVLSYLSLNQSTWLRQNILGTWQTILWQDGNITDQEQIADQLLQMVFCQIP